LLWVGEHHPRALHCSELYSWRNRITVTIAARVTALAFRSRRTLNHSDSLSSLHKPGWKTGCRFRLWTCLRAQIDGWHRPFASGSRLSKTENTVKEKLLYLLSVALMTVTQIAHADDAIRVTYAGSMGLVMDRSLGPAFAQKARVEYEGQGDGAYGMARLLASKKVTADVFVSITPGPIQILKDANLVDRAVPVASTSMVIAYNPKSAFAKQLEAATTAGGTAWWKVLQSPGLRFGRTDARIDPQGQNIIFTMKLAEKYYGQPGLAQKILGDTENPQQVFVEGGLLTRLEAGQIDASSGYQSAAISAKLPYVSLPDEINLSNPGDARKWYDTVSFPVTNAAGKQQILSPQPLVFYATVLKNAPHPQLARAFIEFMQSAAGQAIFKQNGYGEPKGNALYQ
jgi:molybdate/tungstate transport system substrate-binding protein